MDATGHLNTVTPEVHPGRHVAACAVVCTVCTCAFWLLGFKGVILLGAPLLGIALAKRPEVCLVLFVFAGVFKEHPLLRLPSGIDWTALLGLATVYWVFIHTTIRGRFSRVRLHAPDALLGTLLLSLAAGLLISSSRSDAARGLLELLVLGVLASYGLLRVLSALRDPEAMARNVFTALLLSGGVLSLATLAGIGLSVRGFASSYLVWGYFLGVSAIAGVAVYSSASPRFRCAVACVLPLLLIALAYTRARGPLLALVGTAIVMLLLHRRGLAKKVVLILSAVTVLTATFAINPSLWGRYSLLLSSDRGASVNARVDAYELAWKMFISHPVIGAGTGSFRHWSVVDPLGHGFSYPHNAILHVLAENGLIGFIFYAAWWFAMLWVYIRAVRDPTISTSRLALLQSAFAAFTFLMLGQQFSGGVVGRRELFFAALTLVLVTDVRGGRKPNRALPLLQEEEPL